MHCGFFKASLTSFTPSSPKMLSAKHKCVNLLLLMRARERSSQPATVRPQLSRLKEKDRWEGISQIPKFLFLFSFAGTLAGTSSPYISTIESTFSNLLKSQMPLQQRSGERRRKIVKVSSHEEQQHLKVKRGSKGGLHVEFIQA